MPIIFAFPEYEKFVKQIQDQADQDQTDQNQTNFELGELSIRKFPDGDSLVTLETDVKEKDVVVVCGLDDADSKIMPLMFFAHTAKELGAKSVGLVTPYLGYMRQDQRFNPGEAITSDIFAKFISSFVDSLVTMDPHLHRRKSLDEIYTIPSTVLHATTILSTWIKENVKNPVLVGPDKESRQWVQDVAVKAGAPFMVLKKVRHGDKDVEVSVPEVEQYKSHTPVLVDDIISTARTMIETVNHLNNAGLKPAVCLGIHAIFADNAYASLKNAGVEKIVTTNTISHETNGIDVTSIFADAIKKL
jgi:ribose-phosphate pyrophosphokinase